MHDIPQPSDTPYEAGDRVRVYIGDNDPDSEHHGLACEVVEKISDGLSEETGRELDSYQYKLQTAETGREVAVWFRHTDLVPESEV